MNTQREAGGQDPKAENRRPKEGRIPKSDSDKEFRQKIGTCRKESKETMFFLRIVAAAEPGLAEEARMLWREAKELNLIFGAIWRK